MSEATPLSPALVATYRLQLHTGFTFADATAVVPYLADLGISHLYLSPIQQAVPGSTHGYDQCDPTRISDELGGETGFRRLCAAARAHGLGLLLDIVPNHMATNAANPWWWELLRSGPDGRAGVYFDVDWEAPEPELSGKVMVPVLASPLAEVLDRGELALVDHDGEVVLAYGDLRFPLAEPVPAAGSPVTSELLARQHYALAWWRDGADHLNYRRFFDIASLVALREEDPAVFVTVHALPLQLLETGDVQGVRIDHVDGLRDPGAYLAMLRSRAPGAWILVEKILEPGEDLPGGWPVDGTTGYDFIHRLQGVFIDPRGEMEFSRFYAEFTGQTGTFEDATLAAKLDVAQRLFTPDMARLERLLASGSPVAAGFNREERLAVIAHVAAHLPVYRTYLATDAPLAEGDFARLEAAVGAASAAGLPPRLVAAVAEALRGYGASADAREFAVRFQQFSGPLAAKGVEDTAFYRYLRLVSLNEVGGDPGRFGVSPADFHAANARTAADYPRAMLASSTHDTKRSEDVRARLSVLAQMPGEWSAAVRRWSALADRHHRGGLPDRNTEYLLYQTLVGAWPLPEDRALAYMEKAVREARQHTSWTDPDAAYEEGVRAFVSAVCGDADIQADLAAFVEPLVEAGRQVSLAQALVKLTAPGVPDIYQGTEAWDLSLVDPDNRRPVDYGLRRELLARHQAAIEHTPVDDQLVRGRWDEGLAKLHLTAQALATRRRFPDAFAPGSTYTPVVAVGKAAEHVLAYARGTSATPFMVVVVVPRLTHCATPEWSATQVHLPTATWSDALWSETNVSGREVNLAELFERHPMALLEVTP